MEFSTFTYLLKMGFKNIRRNKVYTIAATLTIAACIFLFGLFYIAMVNVESIIKTSEDRMPIQVYFDEQITEQQVDAIGKLIRSRSSVAETRYISAADAWADFQDKIFADDPSLTSGIGEDDNPLENSDSYVVYVRGIEQQKPLAEYLRSVDGVRKVVYSEAAADAFTTLNWMIAWAVLLSMIILILISVVIINNSLAVGMEARKEKIRTMLLMGARASFVRMPFVVEGLSIGMIGAFIPIVGLLAIYNFGADKLAAKLSALCSGTVLLPASAVFPQFIMIAVLIGIGVGLLGSFVTLRKHLKF